MRRVVIPLNVELIVNGTFGSDTAWTKKTPIVGTEAVTISDGVLNLTGDGTNYAWADQSFNTVANTTYLVSGNSVNTVGVLIGTAQGGSTLLNTNLTPAGATFVATGTTTWIRLRRQTASLATADNIPCAIHKDASMFLGGIVNGKWCKGEEFFAEKAKARDVRSSLAGPRVFSDCIEVRSMGDGKIYTSKALLRRHYRERGLIEVGNEKLAPPPKPKPDRKAIRDAAGKALNRVGISVPAEEQNGTFRFRSHEEAAGPNNRTRG